MVCGRRKVGSSTSGRDRHWLCGSLGIWCRRFGLVVRGGKASTEAWGGLFEIAGCRIDIGLCLCLWLDGVDGTGSGRDGKDEEEEDGGVEEDKEEEEETEGGGWWPHVAARGLFAAAGPCVGAGEGEEGLLIEPILER